MIHSGIEALDEVLQGIRLGDNIVWQVDQLEDYKYFVEPFASATIKDGWKLVYIRFASHEPLLYSLAGLEIIKLDSSLGFDVFTREVHEVIEKHGHKVFYIFDDLSTLVEDWATDELLANFFQVTCPYLYELDTVTYFALTRGKHAHNAVARIRDTTQILVDVYNAKGQMHIHPIKVWDRYSPQMFLPHLVAGKKWSPLSHSREAAELLASARRSPLSEVTQSQAPWESVYQKLINYKETPLGFDENDSEQLALKQELCHMLIGQHPVFNKLAEKYFTLSDLFTIRSRLIGTGRIGGKAAGMLLARCILESEKDENGINISECLEDHDSFYIGSDVFFTFLVNNNLFRLRLQLTRESSISNEDFKEVENRFLAGRFSPSIREQFRAMLDYYGQAPIIVRSSSLLEDSFGNAFAGKYQSIFCANQGDPDMRLEAFMNAVKLVYASTINPDALSYRRKRGLGDKDEQMAILVQRVSGMPYKNYFFPALAGVAFSHNLYAWNDRIDPNKGIIRLVFGLGTRAVERIDSDYPRMIAISHPGLRPEAGAKIAKYSQHQVDLLDLNTNQFTSVYLSDLLTDNKYPNLHLFISIMHDNHPYNPMFKKIDGNPQDWLLTFNNLLHQTNFVNLMENILLRLEKAYGQPVDLEFTASVDENEKIHFNLLQCRPLYLPGSGTNITAPSDINSEKILFTSKRMICGGVAEHIRFILFIDPQKYNHLESIEIKKSIGRIVGQINRHPAIRQDKILFVGPGRWGSSNINLGVNISYADIDSAVALAEMAIEEGGHIPEVSYGTHFFQDLVEDQVIYLPVYPNNKSAMFNDGFFNSACNSLLEILPDAGKYMSILKLIDVPKVTKGMHVKVIADQQHQKAICFLE